MTCTLSSITAARYRCSKIRLYVLYVHINIHITYNQNLTTHLLYSLIKHYYTHAHCLTEMQNWLYKLGFWLTGPPPHRLTLPQYPQGSHDVHQESNE